MLLFGTCSQSAAPEIMRMQIADTVAVSVLCVSCFRVVFFSDILSALVFSYFE